MPNLKLSIIIPTLDEEIYLPLLLESIKKQDFSDYEIIVADANSKDKTREIAEGYECKIVAGGSVAKGRNQGAKIAKGDLFLFVDADMFFPSSGFLVELIEKFEKNELGVATFPVYPVTDHSTSEHSYKIKKVDKGCYQVYNFWVKTTQRILPHAYGTILIKKEFHQKAGGFDEKITIGEDHAYARQAAKFSKFGFLSITPILVSARRFECDGRSRTYLKYVLAGIHMLFWGSVKSNIFKYHFNHYRHKLKK